MPGFKTYFPVKGIRTDVTITSLEDNIYAIELESTDVFDEATTPGKQSIASNKAPKLMVQKTKNNWAILFDDIGFDLDQEDLKALGSAIEHHTTRRI